MLVAGVPQKAARHRGAVEQTGDEIPDEIAAGDLAFACVCLEIAGR